MLVQLHHQYRNDWHREFQGQREINNPDELREWIKEMNWSHPPPKGSSWLIVEESSEYFCVSNNATCDTEVQNDLP